MSRREGVGSEKPAWRWLIYFIASVGVLIACLWAFGALISSMGWSGRSDTKIALIIILLLLLPLVLSVFFAIRANAAARQGDALRATAFAVGSFLCAPTAWWLLSAGLFAP